MRELLEEAEVAGEFVDGDDGVIAEYQISGDVLVVSDADAAAKIGILAANVLRMNQQETLGACEVEVSGDEVLGLEYDAEVGRFKLFKKVAKGLKKAGNFVKRNPLTVVAPGMVPAFKLLNAARKKAPGALSRILQVKQAAKQGSPVAEKALENIEAANIVQQEASEEYDGDSHYYDPEGSEDYADEYGYGTDEPTELLGGFSLKKLKKWTGRTLDVTRKDNPLRKFVPPQALAAADLVAKAGKGLKDAKNKIAAVKDAAKTGDPTAQAAADNIKLAEEAAKKAEREKLLKYGGIAAAGVAGAALLVKVAK